MTALRYTAFDHPEKDAGLVKVCDVYVKCYVRHRDVASSLDEVTSRIYSRMPPTHQTDCISLVNLYRKHLFKTIILGSPLLPATGSGPSTLQQHFQSLAAGNGGAQTAVVRGLMHLMKAASMERTHPLLCVETEGESLGSDQTFKVHLRLFAEASFFAHYKDSYDYGGPRSVNRFDCGNFLKHVAILHALNTQHLQALTSLLPQFDPFPCDEPSSSAVVHSGAPRFHKGMWSDIAKNLLEHSDAPSEKRRTVLADQPSQVTAPLYAWQKRELAFMRDRESLLHTPWPSTTDSFRWVDLGKDGSAKMSSVKLALGERALPRYVLHPASSPSPDITEAVAPENRHVVGGVLMSDDGMGKTLSVLALVASEAITDADVEAAERERMCIADQRLDLKRMHDMDLRELDDEVEITQDTLDVLVAHRDNGVEVDEAKILFYQKHMEHLVRSRGDIEECRALQSPSKQKYPSLATLVICQPDLVDLWKLEAKKHLGQSFPVLVNQGSTRIKDSLALSRRRGIVICSVNVVKEGTPVLDVSWRRCIFDDANTILPWSNIHHLLIEKHPDFATRRWCLTSTNCTVRQIARVMNLNMQIREVRHADWRRPRSVDVDDADGNVNFNMYLRGLAQCTNACLMRHTMDKDATQPFRVTYTTRDLYMTSKIQQRYDTILAATIQSVEALRSGDVRGGGGTFLASERCVERLSAIASKGYVTKEETKSILNSLCLTYREDPDLVAPEGEDCAICMDIIQNPLMTPCNHWFCRDCMTDALRHSNSCPLCRHRMSIKDIRKPVSSPDDQGDTDEDTDEDVRVRFRHMVAFVEEHVTSSPADSKLIVCCHDPALLEEVHAYIARASRVSIDLVTRNSVMKKKVQAVERFSAHSGRAVLFFETSTSTKGLNLSAAADHIAFSDFSSDNSTEDKLINRINRLGRVQKPLTVTRFVMRDTMEESYENYVKTQQNVSFPAALKFDILLFGGTEDAVDIVDRMVHGHGHVGGERRVRRRVQ
jgi:hypothetical protein